jgi:hypothetical protein
MSAKVVELCYGYDLVSYIIITTAIIIVSSSLSYIKRERNSIIVHNVEQCDLEAHREQVLATKSAQEKEPKPIERSDIATSALGHLENVGDKEVRHLLLVLCPRLTVDLTTPGDITKGAVNDHTSEEDGVEPGKRRVEAGDQTPRDSEEKIASVVDLACLAVPAISQDLVSVLGGDGLGVGDATVLEVGEGGALVHNATLFLAELVLLAVGGVPDVVHAEVGDCQGNDKPCRPSVLARVVVGDVECAVAVGEGHTSHVPEDEHEAELLVVHVPEVVLAKERPLLESRHLPGSDDQVLALGARVGIKPVSKEEEDSFAGDVAIRLVLLQTSTERQEEEDEPRNANLKEHLEVQNAKEPGVQLRSKEEVDNDVVSHADGGTTDARRDVCDSRAKKTGDNGNGHNVAELINQSVELEDASEVEGQHDDDAGIEGPHCGAVVVKLLSAQVRKRLALAVDSRHEHVESHLHQSKEPVDLPRLVGGVRFCFDQVPHVSKEV